MLLQNACQPGWCFTRLVISDSEYVTTCKYQKPMKLILGKAPTSRDLLKIWIFFLVLWPKFPQSVFSYSFCCISNTAERNRRSNVVKQHVRNSRDYHQSAHLHGSFPPKRSTLPRSVSLPAFEGESQTGDGSSQQQHHCPCIKVCFPTNQLCVGLSGTRSTSAL